MDETEWLESENPFKMLEFLQDRASERKLRLFATACCIRTWILLKDERSRDGVQLALRHASGDSVTRLELEQARERAYQAGYDVTFGLESLDFDERHRQQAALAVGELLQDYRPQTVAHNVMTMLSGPPDHTGFAQAFYCDTKAHHARLLREVFGNPFRIPEIDSFWLKHNGGCVSQLAAEMDSQWTFEQMPILADALEEAGCTNVDVLNHCRQPGEHVRGCWLLDLLLCKV